MKKILSLLLMSTMLLSCASCGTEDTSAAETTTTTTVADTEAESDNTTAEAETEETAEVPETITIQSLNGDKVMADLEVPYNPERIAVLDMAALDILDSIGVGDKIVGCTTVSIEYLADEYNPDNTDGKIANVGTVKTADLEALAVCEPDVIFIGGRLSKSYADLSAIAPVVYLAVDYEKGVVQSTADNAKTIASMFGKEAEIDAMVEGYNARIEALRAKLEGKTAVLGMYNNNALGLQDSASQLSIMANELGMTNLSETVGEVEKATHGEEASWETIISLNPEYMFILDRSSAVSSEDEVLGAKEVIENDLIKELDVYKNGNIVYFIEHANVWYTSTGGIQALDTMLADLEAALA